VLPDSVDSISIYEAVRAADVAQFITDMKAKGGVYTNFTITGIDSNNTVVGYYPYEVSFVKTLIAPLKTTGNTLGYDASSSDVKTKAIKNSFSTMDVTCSGKSTATFTQSNSVTVYAPILQDGIPTAVSSSVIILSQFMSYSTLPGSLDSVIMQLYDTNETGSDSFLYSSMTQGQVPYSGVSVDDLTYDQHIALQSLYPYTVTFTVTIADRIWKVVMLPTVARVAGYTNAMKWVYLFLCIAAALVIIVVVIVFVKRMEYATKTKRMEQARQDLLLSSTDKIQTVMNRISDAERQIRVTIDGMLHCCSNLLFIAIPDFITVITSDGSILAGNSAFEKQFGFNDVTYQKKINISTIFPDIQPDFYDHTEDFDEIATDAKTRFQSRVPVRVSVRPLNITVEDDDDDSSFVVIARNMSDKNKLLENLQLQEAHMKNVLKYAEFDAQFNKNKKFREGFLQFCKTSRTEESVLFLNEIRKYKTSSVEKRVTMQHTIYETFIRIGTKSQLNISLDLSKQVEIRLLKSLGDVELFHEIEEFVKSMIVVDSYPRYLRHIGDSSL
jgi:PAS domain-containing protein